MKKKIGYSLLGLILIAVILGIVGIRMFNNKYFKETPAYLELSHQSQPIKFKWTNNNIEGHIERQTAMLVPVQIDSLKHNLNMQFDTGAPDSLLYEKDIISLRALGVEIKEVQKDGLRFVESIDLILGGQPVTLSMIRIYPNYGNHFSAEFDPKVNISIGTLGSDVLVNRITSIDFKNRKLQFFEKRPEWMQDHKDFKAFDFPGRRIMLPVTVDGKDYEFLYDSGCSAFGLITTKQRFKKYTEASNPLISYAAKSWQDEIAIHTKISDYTFTMGGTELSFKRVSCVDMYAFFQPLVTPLTRIGGWMGNQSINESQLILDTQTNEFMIIP